VQLTRRLRWLRCRRVLGQAAVLRPARQVSWRDPPRTVGLVPMPMPS